jgi:dihydroorotase
MEISENKITMRCPDNWHAHFRDKDMLHWMVKMFLINGWRGRVLAMPNLLPPLLVGDQAHEYRNQILEIANLYQGNEYFDPVVTIQITEQTTPEMVSKAKELGIRAAKVYPRNVTTNSEHGVVDYTRIYPALETAQKCGMIICFHGEHPSYEVEGLDKEKRFLSILASITTEFKELKIVLEHITTAAAVQWVIEQPEQTVAATITVHHLFTTLDDVLGYSERSGGKMNFHLGCKPQPKFREDLKALRWAAFSNSGRFFYGGDDAPHLLSAKHTGSCGVFNTSVALPLLIQLFQENNVLEQLEDFLSRYGAEYYGFSLNDHSVSFERKPWIIPAQYMPYRDVFVVPMFAGQTLEWSFVR